MIVPHEHNNIRELILIHQRRLQKLKEQHALLSINTPPHVLLEIEDKEQEINKLCAQLGEVTNLKQALKPIFLHRYPLENHFTGRTAERERLTEWVFSNNEPILVLIAIGGMGKSSLAWYWVNHDVLSTWTGGVLWWSFYEGESSFSSFLNKALAYVSHGLVTPDDLRSDHEKVRYLVKHLQERKVLLVLDGFERQLQAYTRFNSTDYVSPMNRLGNRALDACSCVDPNTGQLLRSLAAGPTAAKVLITSRLMISDLEDRIGEPLDGCRKEILTGLDPASSATFMKNYVKIGTDVQIIEACRSYDYHPLSLRLLAGMIARDKRNPGNIGIASRYSIHDKLISRRHHILEAAHDALSDQLKSLLSRIAAFRGTITYDELLILNEFEAESEFDCALDELQLRGLLQYDSDHNLYDLHAVVRRYAYDRLTDRTLMHAKLADYYAAIPVPEKVTNLDELTPLIEQFHHRIRAKTFEQVYEIIDELRYWLYYYHGAYNVFSQILSPLVIEESDLDVPGFDNSHQKAFILNVLANSLIAEGKLQEALALLKRAVDLDSDTGVNYPVHVGNLGVRLMLPLGKLAEAETLIKQRITLCRESFQLHRYSRQKRNQKRARFHHHNEKIGHSDLGYLYAIQGRWSEAKQEFTRALRMFRDPQSKGIVHRLRGYALLMSNHINEAAKESKQAAVLAQVDNFERDRIHAEALQGAVALAKASQARRGSKTRQKYLSQAEQHLTDALTQCRRVHLVEVEPDILISWAKWHFEQNNIKEARQAAEEALMLADGSGYRLKQADIYNFLAMLYQSTGDTVTARKYAERAKERAWCDGPPAYYKTAADRAAAFLKSINATTE